jgi:predicted flap endonuclease-1-like 5' DNA nuclease
LVADRADDVLAVLHQVQAEGVSSLRAIAAELHARGVFTPAGKAQWSPEQVRRLLARSEVASTMT